jgi:perosamine synthetase
MISVSRPYHSEAGIERAKTAIELGEISGLFGENIVKFEEAFAAVIGTRFAIACSSGTAALHLALHAAGIGAGDEVLCTTTTNMASFFAILYCGAKPVPIDITDESYRTSISDLKSKINERTKAILIVNLFGMPNNMTEICEYAKKRNLKVIEDNAEAIGSTNNENMLGSQSLAGCFSFFANKNLNSGEGGIITTNDEKIFKSCQRMRSLNFGDKSKFMHEGLGYNYRMTGVQAALAYQQTIEFETLINLRIKICERYNELFKKLDMQNCIPPESIFGRNTYWMYLLTFKNLAPSSISMIIQTLSSMGVETREGFVPFNEQTNLKFAKESKNTCPVASSLNGKSFYIPTFLEMTESQQEYIADSVKAAVDRII